MTKVQGLDALKRQIAALAPAQVRAAKESLEKGAEELSAAIRRAAPTKSGDLAMSVGWSHEGGAPKGSIGGGGQGSVRGEAGLAVEVHAGDEKAYYARFVEYGTEAAPAGRSKDKSGKSRNNKRAHIATRAQPFFWPTVRSQKKRVVSRVARNANKAAKAVAAKK